MLRSVVQQGLTPALMGLAAGVAGALVLTRWMETLLFGVAPTDPMTLVSVAAIVTIVALMAWITLLGEARRPRQKRR